jgi:hypothetical protein
MLKRQDLRTLHSMKNNHLHNPLHRLFLTNGTRILAWGLLTTIIVLTIVPPCAAAQCGPPGRTANHRRSAASCLAAHDRSGCRPWGRRRREVKIGQPAHTTPPLTG